MATRPGSNANRRPSAIGQSRDSRWRPLFISAVGAVAISVIVLIVVVAASCAGDGGPSPAASVEYITATNTATETATSTATKTATPTAGKTTTPANTATSTPANNGGNGSTNGGNTGDDNDSGDSGGDDADTDNTPVLPCNNILVPLDKQHRLSASCAPSDLVELPADISAQGAQYMRSEAASALERMFADAANAGYQLVANSTYRSYQTQVQTFNYWVSVDGLDYAERTSARPGHSEHQLGTVADVGTASGDYLEAFTGTPEAAWLDANCYKYGFIVSYPPGTESITGYASEPWHVRYVGVGTAAQVRASGLTLHQFLLN